MRWQTPTVRTLDEDRATFVFRAVEAKRTPLTDGQRRARRQSIDRARTDRSEGGTDHGSDSKGKGARTPGVRAALGAVASERRPTLSQSETPDATAPTCSKASTPHSSRPVRSLRGAPTQGA